MSNGKWMKTAARSACAGMFAAAALAQDAALPEVAIVDFDPDAIYSAFNDFARDHFGAQNEPLYYDFLGRELSFIPEGDWVRPSPHSAVVAFETSLPADAFVEFGATTDYGRTTEKQERPFFIHIHTLRGLEPETTYHYRRVAVDERGERLVGEDRTFTTGSLEGAIRIPDDLEGPPYVLDRQGATYVVTSDIVADETAIEIREGEITLDLNGHTLTYNNRPMGAIGSGPTRESFWPYRRESAMGIRTLPYNKRNINIYNGIVRQGDGRDSAQQNGQGFSPIWGVSGRDGEIAGVTVDYCGTQVTGIDVPQTVRHCIVIDRGTKVINRHQGCRAINPGGEGAHHNLVKRARQGGIGGGSNRTTSHNEIWIDGWATNASGIGYYKSVNAAARRNRIFGTGYLTMGIGTLSDGLENIEIGHNLIHLETGKPQARWAEYGERSGAFGVRVTWGGVNVNYHHNLIIANSRFGGHCRAVWFCPKATIRDVVFRHNIIKSLQTGSDANQWGAITVTGDADTDVLPGIFEHNRVISNYAHIGFGDSYGYGNNAIFRNNVFERVGDREDYLLARIGYWDRPNAGNVFVDNTFAGDTGYDRVAFWGSGERNMTAGWTVTLRTEPGATVLIDDATGETVFDGAANDQGELTVELMQLTWEGHEANPQFEVGNGRRIDLTPHQVRVTHDGRMIEREITADRTQTVEIPAAND